MGRWSSIGSAASEQLCAGWHLAQETTASLLRPASWLLTARRGATSTSPPRSNTAAAPMPASGAGVGRCRHAGERADVVGVGRNAYDTRGSSNPRTRGSGMDGRGGCARARCAKQAQRGARPAPRTRADAHGHHAKARRLAAPLHLVQQRGGLHRRRGTQLKSCHCHAGWPSHKGQRGTRPRPGPHSPRTAQPRMLRRAGTPLHGRPRDRSRPAPGAPQCSPAGGPAQWRRR